MPRDSITDAAEAQAEEQDEQNQDDVDQEESIETSSTSDEERRFTHRMPEELVSELDEYVDGHSLLSSRRQALNYIVDEHLQEEGVR